MVSETGSFFAKYVFKRLAAFLSMILLYLQATFSPHEEYICDLQCALTTRAGGEHVLWYYITPKGCSGSRHLQAPKHIAKAGWLSSF